MSSELFVDVTFHRLACLKIFPLSQMTDPPGHWTMDIDLFGAWTQLSNLLGLWAASLGS